MIVWKAIKWKHVKQAQDMSAAIRKKTAPGEAIIEFVMTLIKDWDYIDPDTDESIPVGRYEELTLEQFGETMNLFGEKMKESETAVPKVTASGLQSGSTVSKPAKGRRQNRPTG